MLLALFFYLAYIMGVIIRNRDQDLITLDGYATCQTFSQCFFIMIRLAFYDTSGLNFITAINQTKNQPGYVLLLFLYIIFTAIILLNGLLGVFRSGFLSIDEIKNEDNIKLQKRNNIIKEFHLLNSKLTKLLPELKSLNSELRDIKDYTIESL